MQSIILCVQVYGSFPWPQIMWRREGKPGDRGRAFEVVQVDMMEGCDIQETLKWKCEDMDVFANVG